MQLNFHLWETHMYLIVQMKIERAHLVKMSVFNLENMNVVK